MLKIEFWDDKNILDIRYTDGFKQFLYLDAILSHPEYPLDEEGKQDVEGIFNAEWQRWRKTFHFDFVAPEYLVDAITTMAIHDNVYIDGLKVKDITVDVNWQGAWAVVDVGFVTDEVIRGTCCTNLTLVGQTMKIPPEGGCYEPTKDPVLGGFGVTDARWYDPLNNGVGQGDRWLLITAINIFNATVQGAIYEYTLAGWVEDPSTEGDGVYVTGFGNMFYDGIWWNGYPYIAMIDQTGVNTYHITGYALPETWVQVQYSLDNLNWLDAGSPVYSDSFNLMGLDVNVTTGDYYWRIDSWTWSCPYDPLNVKYKESGYWLINDAGDYFLQNGTSTDKWYR